MLNRSLKVQTVGFAILLALSFLPAPLFGSPQGRIAIYQSAIGQTSFALSLTPGNEVTSAQSVQVVVLFDTSASQTGLYRTDALAALETFLGSLTPVDRVRLVAVDLEPVELTNGFVAPNGRAIDAAVSKLKFRAPLGATDMGKLLKFAAGCFVGPTRSPRCAVYIGDGLSKANYLDKSEFAGLMKQMVERRVAFSSYVIGPLRDIHLVAAIVNNTGGSAITGTFASLPEGAPVT
ncbi:MAG: hypothetical protein IH991_20485, partial [Planctomycetes bacterium]|nr:hypothetical protein [Planctomycetota bacterium]